MFSLHSSLKVYYIALLWWCKAKLVWGGARLERLQDRSLFLLSLKVLLIAIPTRGKANLKKLGARLERLKDRSLYFSL